jgi:hypothetical protein
LKKNDGTRNEVTNQLFHTAWLPVMAADITLGQSHKKSDARSTA